jgi:hypothetical protein
MTLSEFRLAVRACVADRLPHNALVMIAEDGATYRLGALTVHVGEQHGSAMLAYVAAPTAAFGHSSAAALPLRFATETVAEATRQVCAWLEDPYLHPTV